MSRFLLRKNLIIDFDYIEMLFYDQQHPLASMASTTKR